MHRALAMPSVCLLVLLIMPSLSSAQSVSDQAKKLQSTSIVIDTHDDTTQRLLDPKFDLAIRHNDGNIDIPRMKERALSAIFFSIWISSKIMGPEAIQKALDQIDAARVTFPTNTNDLILASPAAALR